MKSIWGLFFGKSYTVKRASALLAVTALLSNALGLFRNIIFYRLLPPDQLDIYYASFRIPDLILNILILGAISSAFIPVLTEHLGKHPEDDIRWRSITNQVMTWLSAIFGALALVLAIAMPWLMELVVAGFDPARMESAILLSRILLVQSVFLAWSFCFGGLLNSFNRFSTYAFAPLVYNIILIAGGFIAAEYGIIALAYAVVIGGLGHCGIQFLEVRKLGYVPQIDFSRSKELREIVRLMIPRSLSLGTSQFTTIVYIALASGLTAGSIAIFSGMNDLQTTPTVIVANSIAIAFFPTLAKHLATSDWDSLNTLVLKAIRTVLFLIIPMVLLGIILRAQVVRLYFGIGGAGWTLTEIAIETFVFFLIGIIPASLVAILSRVFYGLKDTRTPLIFGSIAAVAGIATAFVGIRYFDGNVAVLALATTVVSGVQCFLLLAKLYQDERFDLSAKIVLKHTLSYLTGGLMAAGVSWSVLNVVHWFYVTTGILGTQYILGLFIQLILAAGAGGLVYYTYNKVLGSEELQWLRRSAFKTP
ncbi:murein biosynthesis integral membrane protein MurJ [soil metagenome]